MAQPDDLLDPDLDAQLRGLFQQAEQAIESKTDHGAKGAPQKREPADANTSPAVTPSIVPATPTPTPAPAASEPPRPAMDASLMQLLMPLVHGLESITKATTENTAALKKFETTYATDRLSPGEAPRILADLKTLLDTKNTVSQGMFSALHDELKGYKDDFLLQSIHRPIIRDLLTFYDDLVEIRRQVNGLASDGASGAAGKKGDDLAAKLRQIDTNLSNHLEFLLEVLHRLDVTIVPHKEGKLDKHTQRAVTVEDAESEEEDGLVVRPVKPGFLWRGSILRPEDVVIKKWKIKSPDEAERKAKQ